MANGESAAARYDAIVVGSGAAGSIMAAKLAAAGKSVLILEAGPARTQSNLVSSAIWARRLKWNGAPVVESGDHPVGHAFNAGFGTGGAALHHYAVWPRLHEEDFRMQSQYGVGLDWPLDYEELRPYYDAVQHEAGISGDAVAEVWRPPGTAYPMAGVPLFEQGRAIKRGFDELSRPVAPLPLAVNSTSYQGRPGCLWDGWCDAGCPIGALANPLTVYLPQAMAAGATLAVDSSVTRIVTSAAGDRVTGVAVRPQGDTEHIIQADVVVLAAFAIQNPRLLLASHSAVHPNGIGNGNDAVGRYISSHSAALVYGLFEQDTLPYKGAFGGQLLNQDNYPKSTHEDVDAFGSYQWMIAQAVRPNDLLGIATTRADLFGPDLDSFMREAVSKFASMTGVVEGLALASNRVTLTDDVDPLGVPLARVHHTHDARSVALWEAAKQDGVAVFEVAGAREVWTGPQGAMHIMGGTIMGADPQSSVTNEYGQLHEVPNLLVAGPGLFPTSGGVNPTFTVHALALRSAKFLIDNWPAVTNGA